MYESKVSIAEYIHSKFLEIGLTSWFTISFDENLIIFIIKNYNDLTYVAIGKLTKVCNKVIAEIGKYKNINFENSVEGVTFSIIENYEVDKKVIEFFV